MVAERGIALYVDRECTPETCMQKTAARWRTPASVVVMAVAIVVDAVVRIDVAAVEEMALAVRKGSENTALRSGPAEWYREDMSLESHLVPSARTVGTDHWVEMTSSCIGPLR
jgi:hypothetical protein